MRFDTFMRAFGEALGTAMAEGGKFRFDNGGDQGEALSDLDLTDAAPSLLRVALSRSDIVRVTAGSALAIDVEGEDKDGLRFRLDDDRLAIMRRGSSVGGAVITLTMPAPAGIAIGGSGTVEVDRMATDSKVAIGGSGNVHIARLDGTRLRGRIGGSGLITVAGKVQNLDLAIGGSGTFRAPALEVERADIRIGGSGNAEFASDGEVKVKIGGVGEVLVHGAPHCSIKVGGSGRVRCIPREDAKPAPEAA